MNQVENEDENPPTQRKLVKSTKMQRYESNSIDEEEFEDCKSIYACLIVYLDFTNPIKRKEFDRQRKRQQMKEMHNVSHNSHANSILDHCILARQLRHQESESPQEGTATLPGHLGGVDSRQLQELRDGVAVLSVGDQSLQEQDHSDRGSQPHV